MQFNTNPPPLPTIEMEFFEFEPSSDRKSNQGQHKFEILYMRKKNKHISYQLWEKIHKPNLNNQVESPFQNGVIVELHGGAYVGGNPHLGFSHLQYLVDWLELPVLALDYRLAPEFPVTGMYQIKDSVAVIIELLHQKYKVPMHKIHLIGESAGGGLVLNCIQYIQEQFVEKSVVSHNVGIAVAISPWTDVSMKYTLKAYEENANKDSQISVEAIKCTRGFVIGRPLTPEVVPKKIDEKDYELWYVSPLYGDVKKLTSARLLLTVSRFEILRDDAILMYEKIIADDKTRINNVQLWIHNSTLHCLPFLTPYVPEAMTAVLNIGYYMKREMEEIYGSYSGVYA